MSYYFERLAAHPPPIPGESLTGYVTLLMEANGMYQLNTLRQLCYPPRTNVSRRDQTRDFPLYDWKPLQALAGTSPEALEALTWKGICRRFGIDTERRAMVAFLLDWVAPQRRYCPVCLDEERRYRLLWGVQPLVGCVKHDCRLWDACHACGQAIPYIAVPFAVGACPTCGAELRVAPMVRLSAAEATRTRQVQANLACILTAPPWALPPTGVSEALGQALMALGQERGLDISTLASTAGIDSIRFTTFLQLGHGEHRLTLMDLWRGMEVMGIALTDLVHRAEQQPDIAALMTQTIMACLREGRRPKKKDMQQSLGLGTRGWYRNPRVQTQAHVLTETLTLAHEEHQVSAAIRQARDAGERMSVVGIQRRCKMSYEHLRSTATLWQMVIDAQRAQADEQNRRDQEAVAQALTDLQAAGTPISYERVGRQMGRSREYLLCRDHLVQVIDPWLVPTLQACARRRVEREQALHQDILVLQEECERNGEPLTIAAATRRLGLSTSAFQKHSFLLAWFRDQADAKRRDRTSQLAQERAAVLQEIATTATQLADDGAPVTYTTLIARLRATHRLTRAKLAVVAEWIGNHCPELLAEEAVYEQVVAAMHTMEREGQALTCAALAQRVGLTVNVLRQYPSVETLFREWARRRSHQRYMRRTGRSAPLRAYGQ